MSAPSSRVIRNSAGDRDQALLLVIFGNESVQQPHAEA
jgi:hypothetical protein